MRENVKKQIRNAKKRRIRRRRFYAAVALCSILVAGIVSWKLILPGTAMSGETYCGKEEHTHSDACYEQVLVCGQEEGTGAHTHTDACYTDVRTDQLICGQEESEGHVHTDACYTNELTCGQEENAEHTHTDACYTKTLTCGQEEGAGAHTHTDACYATERKLTCGQEEGAGHTHTDACYKTELTCGKEEHKHTSECYSNPDAVETEEQWKAAFKNYKLTGEWGKDTAAVAKSQVGYKESTENYKVNEDKSTDGYTRYADWAGDDIYGDWNTDFAAFCLNYAGVPADKFPVNADDLGAWITAMNNAGYYGNPDSAESQPGDLIVLKKADQDNKQTVGIVSEVKTDKDGNATTVKAIEGDCDDAVKENKYDADGSEIVGYGLVNKAYEDVVGSGEEETSDKTDENGTDESALVPSVPKKAVPMRAAKDSDLDLTDYLTHVSTQKLQGNEWVPTTDFTDGDTIKVQLSYSLPGSTVHQDNEVVYYQVPGGIKLSQAESGTVYDGNKPVGTYSISESGYVKIEFNEEFADGNAFTGEVEFEGKVHKTEGGDSSEIKFGTVGTITVKPSSSPTDVSVNKTGYYNKDDSKLHYTLTVTTNSGTDDIITINDYLGGNTPAKYDEGSFTITKSDGSQISGTLTIQDNNNGSQRFELTLPGLNAEETYIINYTVIPENTPDLTGYSNVTNSVQTSTGGHDGGTGWSAITIQQSIISKWGSYDSSTGKIKWTVTLNAVDKDLQGFVLKDTITSSDGITVKLPENVKLNGTSITLPYTFPEDSTGEYTITYETTVEGLDPGETASVTNKAEITDGDEEYSKSTTVWPQGMDYGLTKKFESIESSDDTKGTYRWCTEITVPNDISNDDISNELLSKLTYTDTLSELYWTDENGETHTVEGPHHYITASQLAGLTVSVNNGNLGYGTDYIICDADGSEITNFEEDTNYTVFQIRFKETALEKLKGQTVRIIYRSTVDYTELDEQISYIIRNTGEIPGHKDDATAEYRKPGKIEKQAKTNVTSSGFTSADFTVDYESFDGTIHYRLLIHTNNETTGELEISDTLPDGTTLSGTPYAKFYYGDWESDSISYNGTEYKLNDGSNFITETGDNNSLKFKIKEGYNGNGQLNTIAIYYDVMIDKGPGSSWAINPGLAEQQYSNSASWDGKDITHTVTVDRDIPKVSKTSVQVKDDTGNYTNTVRYYVTINQASEDIDPKSDSLELVDTLSNLGDLAEASLDLDRVELYHYDGNADNYCGKLIDGARYNYEYNPETHTITFQVPDSTAMVLMYEYTFDLGNKQSTTIKNEVSLTGIKDSKTEETTELHETSSSASASKRVLTIYKVDSTNYGKHLAGAEFGLAMFNSEKDAWTDKDNYENIIRFTTDENGKFDLIRDDDTVWKNFEFHDMTLYRLQETGAPEGYTRDDSYYYFVWTGGKSIDESRTEMKDTLQKAGVNEDEVMFIEASFTSVYIPNEPTDITVQKIWTDKDGRELTDPQNNGIKVQLYRQTAETNGKTVTVVSKGHLSWSTTHRETIDVASGSDLTIQITGVYKNSLTIQIGNSDPIDVETGNGQVWVYTLHGITEDTDITIVPTDTEEGNSFGSISFHDYMEPYLVPTGTATMIEEVTLSNSNKWTKTWDGNDLLKVDDYGNPYYYTVKEEVPDGYTVIYSSNNNSGIQAGEITITNQANGYILPETGGIGTKVYIAGGAILMMSSCLFGGYRMRRKRESRRR